MSRLRRLLAVGVAAAAVALTAVPVHAQEQQDSAYAPTMVVLDASGSMQAPDAAGGTKMDAAKAAVHTFVDAAPAESEVGLSVYGTATGNSDAEKSAGCRDVVTLRKPESIDKAGLNSAVDGITASGYTPIGESLRAAAKELPQSGSRSIVLVSDGEDTCAPPDPCEVAQELNRDGAKIIVHAIGFGVDDRSREQLTCIAQKTGGTYNDAVDGAALKQILPRVSQAALRTYKPIGTPITGTPTYNDAPTATPGQYLDTMGKHEKKYYAVDVPQGATAYVSATLSFPLIRDRDSITNDTSSMDIRVYGAGGQDCNAFDFESTVYSSHGVSLTVAETWDGATKQKGGDSPSADACRGGGRYYFAPEWRGVVEQMPDRVPMELAVAIEPGVSDPGPAATTSTTPFTAPGGEPVSVVGAGSFNAATTLNGSGSYADVVQRGEVVYYRARLDWGQGLAYRVTFDETERHGVDGLSVVTTTLYSPMRKRIDDAFTSYNGDQNILPGNDPALATVPVRYRNRDAGPGDADQSMAGWYYIGVKIGPSHTEGVGSAVPIRIDLHVAGDPEPGPAYESPTADGVFGENATPSDGGASTAESTITMADLEDSDDGGSLMMVLLPAGVIVLIAVLGATIVLVRRRAARK
ncbi:vWA domain-containing protein [Nocardia vermiculata]|uniref:VWA domain-containing protein n=1 Tax=Nocardia vermiculata TaxID=257274 RepID=A0A846Y7L5_9NOCA|nr:VWA domain-containing protein [Nocardia vermiculata]NKY53860.1 VWA domain-containing protein [Nocardia vermiculata]